MSEILVVDDSPIDRVLIEGMLKKDPRLKVRHAANGADALALLGQSQPDVIVTDLQMPELNGLELVTAVQLHYPRVPVVLITGHGSEELAVQALEQGAASYVPKSQLAARLVASVEQVLELARDHRSYEALTESMEYAEFRFRAENNFAVTDRLVELCRQVAGASGACDVGGQLRLGMALEEALRMAVLRGNLELSPAALLALSARRDEMDIWLAEHCKNPRIGNRRITVAVKVSRDTVDLSIAHEGPPWNISEAPASNGNPSLEDPADRSLVLMRAFMDEVHFDVDGRAVTLVKRKSSA